MAQNQPNNGSQQPQVTFRQTDDYRESYSNSVQVRMSVWDFQLIFGTLHQVTPTEVDLKNFQCVYLSPQQAKALSNILSNNLAQYEQAFGKIALEPIHHAPVQVIMVPEPNGPIN